MKLLHLVLLNSQGKIITTIIRILKGIFYLRKENPERQKRQWQPRKRTKSSLNPESARRKGSQSEIELHQQVS